MGIRDSTRAERTASWLKIHSAAERSFARALQTYFSEQADRLADVVRENFPGGVSPDQTALILNRHSEDELLRPIIRRNLSGLLVVGARAEQRALQRRRDAKDYADDLMGLDMPEETLRGLRQALDELEQQPYWLSLQDEAAANLRAIIEAGIEERLGTYAISMRIRETLGGFEARKRALRIARTESTSAMNAGHVAFIKELEDSGIVVGRQWEAIGDGDMRPEHGAINGVIVPSSQPFNVGGYPAPYPGHWSLPAAQRINCRCTVLSVFAEEFTPSEGDADGYEVDLKRMVQRV